MKKFISLLFFLSILFTPSCLKWGLEDLPEYDQAEVTGVQKVEYRFVDETTVSSTDGLPVVKYVNLSRKTTVNAEAGTVEIEVTVPAASGAFPEAKRAACTQSNICVMVAISTAAKIEPVSGAPKLGVPGDWSKSNSYKVTAADGTTKNWTITVTKFTK